MKNIPQPTIHQLYWYLANRYETERYDIIYKLYWLTDEEIQIVEDSVK